MVAGAINIVDSFPYTAASQSVTIEETRVVRD